MKIQMRRASDAIVADTSALKSFSLGLAPPKPAGGGRTRGRGSADATAAMAPASTPPVATLAESSSAGSLERIVRDSDGIMAAAAAERAAWEATALPEPEAWQLPDDMHATLREHTPTERTFPLLNASGLLGGAVAWPSARMSLRAKMCTFGVLRLPAAAAPHA